MPLVVVLGGGVVVADLGPILLIKLFLLLQDCQHLSHQSGSLPELHHFRHSLGIILEELVVIAVVVIVVDVVVVVVVVVVTLVGWTDTLESTYWHWASSHKLRHVTTGPILDCPLQSPKFHQLG